MNQVVGYAILLVVVVALIGTTAPILQGLFILVFMLAGAAHLLVKQKLPVRFWANILLLVLGPCVLLWLLSLIKAQCQSLIQ